MNFTFFRKGGNVQNGTVPAKEKTENELIAEELRSHTWLKSAHDMLNTAMDDTMDKEQRILFIRSSIRAIVTEIQGFYLARSLAGNDGITLRSLLDYPYRFGGSQTFTTAGEQVIACTWSLNRLEDSVADIEREGYVSERETAHGVLFKELGMVLITNHNHHPAAVILMGRNTDGIAVSGPVVTMAKEDRFHFTDDFRFADENGEPLDCVSDPRFVLALRLGQILGHIETDN